MKTFYLVAAFTFSVFAIFLAETAFQSILSISLMWSALAALANEKI